MNHQVRVRFAPSPTGYPHIGNIRTALFNWLFARHHNGKFILRIEDTDVMRQVEGAVEAILDSLRWLGLDWDEGPYYQSQRLQIYQEIAQNLVREEKAYFCYCSPQRLEKMRQEQIKNKRPPGYDRHCRYLSQKARSTLESQGAIPVVRFQTPLEGETSFDDLIRGKIHFQNNTLDDFVLLKSDGYPTYHLANIVDDHLMAISHVLRAEEWLSSTPRHILLYQSLGWKPPEFAHLPMILGPDRAKLSKRHGATAFVEYQNQGYLPEAMINFLALLGWSLDDKTEFLTRDEIVKYFSLDRVSKTAAIFNKDKLDWMNGVYLRRLSPEELAAKALPFLEKGLPSSCHLSREYVLKIIPLIQERITTLSELPRLTDFFFIEELDYDVSLLSSKGINLNLAPQILNNTLERLEKITIWDVTFLENCLRPLAKDLGLATGDFFGLLRVAITGRTAAPPLFETMAVLGRERCLNRLKSVIRKLTDRR